MTTETRRVTAEELLRMPDRGFRYESIEGDPRKMAPAGYGHGHVAGELFGRVRSDVKANGLGRVYIAETGFLLARDPDTVRAPDAAYVGRARPDEGSEVSGCWPGVPDPAVEVIPPNDRHSEVQKRALAWLGAGRRMVPVADSERRTVTVYRSREDTRTLKADAGDTVDGADVVPGWKLPVAQVFA